MTKTLMEIILVMNCIFLIGNALKRYFIVSGITQKIFFLDYDEVKNNRFDLDRNLVSLIL